MKGDFLKYASIEKISPDPCLRHLLLVFSKEGNKDLLRPV
jgi:hypothetical protein